MVDTSYWKRGQIPVLLQEMENKNYSILEPGQRSQLHWHTNVVMSTPVNSNIEEFTQHWSYAWNQDSDTTEGLRDLALTKATIEELQPHHNSWLKNEMINNVKPLILSRYNSSMELASKIFPRQSQFQRS